MMVPVGKNVNVNLQVFPYSECIALAAGNISDLSSGQRVFGRRKNRLERSKSKRRINMLRLDVLSDLRVETLNCYDTGHLTP